MLPLDGVTVIDLTSVVAGPLATQIMAQQGARVWKVEPPEGDRARLLGAVAAPGFSSAHVALNADKQSVAIDFASEAGAARIRELVADADILVENYKAGGLRKYGLDYASLARVNPRLIYLSITGYGQSGPLAGKPGYDYVFQGMGGLMSYTGQPDGTPGAGPLRTGVAVVDLMTGMYATSAVLAALRQRDQTGQGMPLDICLLDVAVALNANQGANYLVSGVAPKRSGNAHPNCAPYEVFACADGHLILAIGNDGQFARFCGVAGHPEWASDARYATNSARLANMDSLRPQVAAALAAAPRQRWTDAFDGAGVPWGPIHTLDEVFAHPQVLHRELLQTTTHPVLGEVRLVRNPLLAGTPASALGAAPPLLGEHTDAVLTRPATI